MLDPKLAQPPGAAIEDREPQVSDRLKGLLQRISAGKAAYEEFAFVSKEQFLESMSDSEKSLSSLGSLQEMVLFGRGEVGDDRVYRYRVRYEKGLLDVKLGLAAHGKVAELDFSAVEDWNAPIRSAQW